MVIPSYAWEGKVSGVRGDVGDGDEGWSMGPDRVHIDCVNCMGVYVVSVLMVST